MVQAARSLIGHSRKKTNGWACSSNGCCSKIGSVYNSNAMRTGLVQCVPELTLREPTSFLLERCVLVQSVPVQFWYVLVPDDWVPCG